MPPTAPQMWTHCPVLPPRDHTHRRAALTLPSGDRTGRPQHSHSSHGATTAPPAGQLGAPTAERHLLAGDSIPALSSSRSPRTWKGRCTGGFDLPFWGTWVLRNPVLLSRRLAQTAPHTLRFAEPTARGCGASRAATPGYLGTTVQSAHDPDTGPTLLRQSCHQEPLLAEALVEREAVSSHRLKA